MRLDEIERELASPRKNRLPRGALLPPDSSHHGTYNGYKRHGCRCERCRSAKAAEANKYRERKRQREKKRAMSYEHLRVERTVRVSRIRNVRCDGCDKQLEHAMGAHGLDHEGLWTNLQPKYALQINLIGGYGMYFDPAFNSEGSNLFFCKDCANRLCEQWPAFDKATKPEEID